MRPIQRNVQVLGEVERAQWEADLAAHAQAEKVRLAEEERLALISVALLMHGFVEGMRVTLLKRFCTRPVWVGLTGTVRNVDGLAVTVYWDDGRRGTYQNTMLEPLP